MTFLNPLMLFAAAAAALPVLFHFIYKKKAVQYSFPAVRFLISTHKRSLLFSRLEGFLLLLIRILLVLLVTAVFARPFFSSLPVLDDVLNFSTVIIVDNSYSMDQQQGEGSAFLQGKEVVKRFIEGIVPGEKLFLLSTGEEKEEREDKQNKTKEELLVSIQKEKISYGNHSLVTAIKKSIKLLSKEKAGVKRIVLVTDLQKYLWNEARGEELKNIEEMLKKYSLSLLVIDMAGLTDRSNIWIEDIRVESRVTNGQFGLDVLAKVMNNSKKAVTDMVLNVSLDDTPAARTFVNLLPGQSVMKRIFVVVSPSDFGRQGSVSIETDDLLPIDDTRYFSVNPAHNARVLIVDGDVRPFSFDSESYYLANAIVPGPEVLSPFDGEVITVDRMSLLELQEYDVFVLCNIEKLPLDIISSLKEQVEKGKGIFFTLGEHTDPDLYNNLFGSLLPAPLRGKKVLGEGEYEHIAEDMIEHRMLEIFSHPESGDFSEAVFKKYFFLKQYLNKESSYLLNFSSGAPFLIVGTKGKGKTALITSTIDREWNTLPIQTVFLPLMHQLMLYLSGNLQEVTNDVLTGEIKEIILNEKRDKIIVENPEGEVVSLIVSGDKRERKGVYKQTDTPGIYTISYPGTKKGLEKEYFAVNLETGNESDVSPVEAEELIEIFGEEFVSVVPFDEKTDIRSLVRKSAQKKELWSPLLLAVIFLLLLESLLSSRAAGIKRLMPVFDIRSQKR